MTPLAHMVGTLAVLAGLVTLSIVAAGCSTPQPIVNHWIHSHEEDTEGVQVYRPSTYAFPPSRGREGFDVRADGSLTVYTIAPADGNDATPGTWSISDDGMLTITSNAFTRIMRYDVAEVDSTILKLRVLR